MPRQYRQHIVSCGYRPRIVAWLLVLANIAACTADTAQAERNIGKLRLGDSSARVLELLGEPAYTHEACGSVTRPGKARERAEGGCGQEWVYGSIFDRRIEVLIDPQGRVGSFTTYGSRSGERPAEAPAAP